MRKIVKELLPESMATIGVKKILGKKITKPKMKLEDRIYLQNLYRDDVRDLEETLGRQLPWNWINQ